MTEAIVVLRLWGESPRLYTYSHNVSMRSTERSSWDRVCYCCKSCVSNVLHFNRPEQWINTANNTACLLVSSLQSCQMQRWRVHIGLSLRFHSELYASQNGWQIIFFHFSPKKNGFNLLWYGTIVKQVICPIRQHRLSLLYLYITHSLQMY